jgi:hypothetical protein
MLYLNLGQRRKTEWNETGATAILVGPCEASPLNKLGDESKTKINVPISMGQEIGILGGLVKIWKLHQSWDLRQKQKAVCYTQNSGFRGLKGGNQMTCFQVKQ